MLGDEPVEGCGDVFGPGAEGFQTEDVLDEADEACGLVVVDFLEQFLGDVGVFAAQEVGEGVDVRVAHGFAGAEALEYGAFVDEGLDVGLYARPVGGGAGALVFGTELDVLFGREQVFEVELHHRAGLLLPIFHEGRESLDQCLQLVVGGLDPPGGMEDVGDERLFLPNDVDGEGQFADLGEEALSDGLDGLPVVGQEGGGEFDDFGFEAHGFRIDT